MTDQAFERYGFIWERVHDLVDELTKDLTEDDDESVREKLTNEFRFWKRLNADT